MRRSLLPIPCAYLAVAIALVVAAPAIDRLVGTRLHDGVGFDSARDVLTSAATGMIAFTSGGRRTGTI
jgi:Predicted membrane protein (DUF2254)